MLGVVSGGMLIVVGVVVWGVTAAAARGRLPRNEWAGIRTGATKASDPAWRAGHVAALSVTRLTGQGTLVIGAAMIIDGLVSDAAEGSIVLWVLFAAGYGGVLVASVIAAQRANRAARATGAR